MRHLITMSLVLTGLTSASVKADPVTEAIEALEQMQMGWLAKVQSRPGVSIRPFESDGCSGGLSDAWAYMAQALPAFRENMGALPPWQPCCVEHDRVYWQGETEQGYQRRLEADKALQICVVQSGIEHRNAFSKRFALSKEEIQQLFDVAAAMMYQAVRAGGKPCSFLPWRWGYGWPQCSADIGSDNG